MNASRLIYLVCAFAIGSAAAGCGSDKADGASPTAPSTTSPTSPGSISATALSSAAGFQSPLPGGHSASALRPFPGRGPAFLFRSTTLEQIYRDLGAPPFATLVDPEGSVVWVSEYLRYRAGQCSADAAFQRILTQINGGGVPAPCGDVEQPFPDRQDALNFRRRLEQVYQSRGARAADTRVNDEGDVIWTMEYLRYVLSGCTHEDTISKIRDQIAGRGVPPACAPMPPAELRADFTVTPNNLQVASPGQCVTEAAPPNNILRCTFDGGRSTPPDQIIAYDWDFFDGVKTFSDQRTLRDVTVPCGSVGAGAAPRPVTLTVRGSGGRSNSRRMDVTFVKPTFC